MGFAIRYSLLTSGSSSSVVVLLSFPLPSIALLRLVRFAYAFISFVLWRVLRVTYGPRVIYHTTAAADRERDAFNDPPPNHGNFKSAM